MWFFFNCKEQGYCKTMKGYSFWGGITKRSSKDGLNGEPDKQGETFAAHPASAHSRPFMQLYAKIAEHIAS
jgi:hypothetical protein